MSHEFSLNTQCCVHAYQRGYEQLAPPHAINNCETDCILKQCQCVLNHLSEQRAYRCVSEGGVDSGLTVAREVDARHFAELLYAATLDNASSDQSEVWRQARSVEGKKRLARAELDMFMNGNITFTSPSMVSGG